MGVPFLDLARLHESIKPDLDAALNRVIKSSAFVGGREVAAFEEAFADAHGSVGAVGCGSGTDALSLTLRALGVGAGDEVIVPSMTFIATAEAVVHAGARPVVCDVDPLTLMMTPETVQAARTERTRAVLPVDLYGHVVPFDAMRAWREDGLLVVEDAAQAHLACWQGQMVGSACDAACFSFYPGKNLGAMGDAGMVISGDLDLLARVRMLRDHGRSDKYVHEVLGWSSRMDGMQAAVLGVKLGHLPRWTERRREVAAWYLDRVGGDTGLVPWETGAVHHLCCARVPAVNRDAIREALAADGIGTGIHYPIPLSRQPWLIASSVPAPEAELAGSELVSLPMDPLMTERDVHEVVSALERAC